MKIAALESQLGQTQQHGAQLESQTSSEINKLVVEVDAMRGRHLTEVGILLIDVVF